MFMLVRDDFPVEYVSNFNPLALKPSDVIAFFKDVSDQAYEIQDAYDKCKNASSKMKVLSVTVFLDDINTASSLGLFKEIIVDKTIDGTVSIVLY